MADNALVQQPAMAVAHFEAMRERSTTNALIERLVLDPAVSVEKLEKLMEMRERMEAMQARKAFDLAIAQAKAEIPPIFKDKHVGFDAKNGGARTDYRHETLAQIARTVDPILGRHGLSYRYSTKQEGPTVTVTCILSHRDGHSEPTTLSSPVDASGNKNPIQAIGSATTYLQRYTLKAALGLSATEVDDDGKSSGGHETITAEQFRELHDALVNAGIPDADMTKLYGVEMLEELPVANFKAALNLIRQRVAKKMREQAGG
jgi:hypothetical protein